MSLCFQWPAHSRPSDDLVGKGASTPNASLVFRKEVSGKGGRVWSSFTDHLWEAEGANSQLFACTAFLKSGGNTVLFPGPVGGARSLPRNRIQIRAPGMFLFGSGPSSDDFNFPLEPCSTGCAEPGNSEGIRTRSEAHAWLGLCLAEGSGLAARGAMCERKSGTACRLLIC